MRLAGEPVAEIDFSSMCVALAYASKGLELTGDPYSSVKYLARGIHARDGMKKCVVSTLFAPNRDALPGFPAKSRRINVFTVFPESVKWTHVEKAVREVHPALADLLYTGAGMRFMRTESDVLISALHYQSRKVARLCRCMTPCWSLHRATRTPSTLWRARTAWPPDATRSSR